MGIGRLGHHNTMVKIALSCSTEKHTASPNTGSSSASEVKTLASTHMSTIRQRSGLPSGCTGVLCDGLLSSRLAEA